jgi:2-methylcitrate dehydratase
MKKKMPQTYKIARFTLDCEYTNLSPDIIEQLKKHLLDTLGSIINAIDSSAIKKMGKQIQSLSSGGDCIVPVLGKTSYDRGAQYFTALNRYPDFMDNFLGKEATCHPSDNIGALLAAAQLTDASGKDFLIAIALGYEIECRLIEELPVMMKGFDHCLLLGISLTAALCKLLGLSEDKTAHAIGIAASTITPLVTPRASYTNEWKGFMSSLVAFNCINIVLLAKEGMTGPIEVFEGPKGYKDAFDMELKYE